MHIDVNAIIEAKLAEMEQSKTIESVIASSIEKVITDSFKHALEDYSLKSSIEKKISAEISDLVNTIGLGGYHEFILQQTAALIDAACKDDLKDRVNEFIKQAYLQKRDSILLTEIIQAYKDMQMEEDERDRYDRQKFFLSIEDKTESYGKYIDVIMHTKEPDNNYFSRSNTDASLCISIDSNGNRGTLITCYIGGSNIDGKKRLPLYKQL